MKILLLFCSENLESTNGKFTIILAHEEKEKTHHPRIGKKRIRKFMPDEKSKKPTNEKGKYKKSKK